MTNKSDGIGEMFEKWCGKYSDNELAEIYNSGKAEQQFRTDIISLMEGAVPDLDTSEDNEKLEIVRRIDNEDGDKVDGYECGFWDCRSAILENIKNLEGMK